MRAERQLRFARNSVNTRRLLIEVLSAVVDSGQNERHINSAVQYESCMQVALQQVDRPVREKVVIAPAAGRYNCISHASGITERWVWDEDWNYASGISSFIQFFQELGYRACRKNERFFHHKRYVVLFRADRDGRYEKHSPTHAIRYDPGKGWTSKEGAYETYRGTCPMALTNSLYGEPFLIMVYDGKETTAFKPGIRWGR